MSKNKLNVHFEFLLFIFGLLNLCMAIKSPIKQLANSKFHFFHNRIDFEDLLEDKGANMCASEIVLGSSKRRYFSECMSYVPSEICEKRTYIRYHCCNGYMKHKSTSVGCDVVKPVRNITSILIDMALFNFVKHWKQIDPLQNKLIKDDETYTFFVPINTAFNIINSEEKNMLSEHETSKNILSNHIIKNRITTGQLENLAQLPTLFKKNGIIRVNRYANGIITVNCVRIVIPNQMATNGIVHATEKIVPIMRPSIMSILEQIEYVSTFVKYLKKLKIDALLENKSLNQPCYTVFAPINDAFTLFEDDFQEKLDDEELKQLLLYHIVDCCICSASILTHSNPKTLEGQSIHLDCKKNDSIFINDKSRAFSLDHVAPNGVVHIIEKVLKPNSLRSLNIALSEMGLTSFLKIVENCKTELSLFKGPYTIFAPTDAVLNVDLENDDTSLICKNILPSYIVSGIFSTKDLLGLKSLKTINEADAKIFVNVYQKAFGIDDAIIVRPDNRMRNGYIHVINNTLTSISRTLQQRLEEHSSISFFYDLLKENAIIDLSDVNHFHTVFAISDSAFKNEVRNKLFTDEAAAKLFLKNYIFKSLIFPIGIKPGELFVFMNLNDRNITLDRRTLKDPIHLRGDFKVQLNLKEFYKASNGVFFIISKFLYSTNKLY